ncbi:MAG: hypothetical protein JXB15_08080 [Anaerolineales bacterium]|nr:hypothetical protein [Anaerolineales bacterium]
MDIGMLWFDNDPKAGLDAKIERAAAYYRSKYGRKPTLCFVHPTMLAKTGWPTQNPIVGDDREKSFVAAGVEVRSHRSVLPNHLWIGVNPTPEAAATR